VENVDEIFQKIEENCYVSSHDIIKELNFDHKIVLRHLLKDWIYKEAWCLGATWFDAKKFNVSNFHLRIIVETKLSHFWKDNERWKMKHTTIIFEKDRSWSEARQTIAKPGLTKEGDVVFDGIGRESSTMSCRCCCQAKRLIC